MKRLTRQSVPRPSSFTVVSVALALASILTLAPVLVAEPAPAGPGGAAPVAAAPVPPPNFLLQWGGAGTGDGQFNTPRGIAVDASGDVYVVDGSNNRVQKFDAAGRYLAQWGSAGPIPDSADGHLSSPFDIAVFRGDASASTQCVYVADTLHSRVQEYLPDGTFLAKWGQWGSGPGQFKQPKGVAVGPSGNVYVIDGLNYRIQKFDADGDFISEWGGNVDQGGVFDVPSGIAVDSLENVYVADFGVRAVLKFSAAGKLLATWTSTGLEDRPWLYPRDVALDAGGRVYVCEDSRVTVFTTLGETLGQWSLQTDPSEANYGGTGIAIAPTGEIYVTGSYAHRVRKYDLAGVLDETPPTTTVSGADDEWHNTAVTLILTATDGPGGSGVERTELRRRGDLSLLWGPWVKSGEVGEDGRTWWKFPAGRGHGDDGEWSVEYRSVDKRGNIEQAREAKVRIDTEDPVVTVRPGAPSPDRGVVVAAIQGKKATIRFTVQDALSPAFKMTGNIFASESSSGSLVHYATAWVPRKAAYTWTFTCRLRPATYRLVLVAEDRAGNVSRSAGADLVVKKAAQ